MARMRDAIPASKKEAEDILKRGPQMPDFGSMYDKGLADGFSIDAKDVVSASSQKNRFSSSTSLSSIPDVIDTAAEGWTRQEMPSLGVPYGISSLFVRPLDVVTLSNVHAAQQMGMKNPNNKQALTMLIDAIAATIKDFDIRNLTVPDFYSHMYWLRLNSYPRSPMIVPWTSRYGNENTTRVTKSTFEFQELAMTEAEFMAWKGKGVTYPTVRDMEVLADTEINDNTRWLMTYAQYIYLEGRPTVDWMKRKVEKFTEMGAEAVPLINEFASLTEHGVIEQVKVRDSKFELDAAIAYIDNEIKQLTTMFETVVDDSDTESTRMGQLLSLGTHLEARGKELKYLIGVKANGGKTPDGVLFQPEEEVVALATANAAILFP